METTKKCHECEAEQLIQVIEDVTFEGEGIKTHTVPNVPHEKCLSCNNRFFGPEGQKVIDQYRRSMTRRKFNGKLSIRIPRTLHSHLFHQAKQEGISLNQFCLYLLSSASSREESKK